MTLAASAALLVLAPLAAHAQPTGGPPPAGGYGGGGYGYGQQPPYERHSFAAGVGLGLGSMSAASGTIACNGCTYKPLAAGVDGHIGVMLNPQLALLGEGQVTMQQLDQSGFAYLEQGMLLAAVQYWVMPQLWIKGGLGFSELSVHFDDQTGGANDQSLDTGTGVLAAAGYEIMYSPRFAIDLSVRLSQARYHGLDDSISSGLVGVGVNWY